MGFQLVSKLVTLNDLEQRNNHPCMLSLWQLSFLSVKLASARGRTDHKSQKVS